MRSRPILLAAALLATGCSLLAPRPDPTRFFVLTALPDVDVNPSGAQLDGLVLGVGPVTLPGYLLRPEMVTRVEPNRVALAEYQRWAEPLDANVRAVLAKNLGALLGTEQVVPYPWFGPAQPRYLVEVDVRRFEQRGDGQVELAAWWTIRDGQRGRLDGGETRLTAPASAPDTQASVAALSGLLGELSREIAAAVRRVVAARPARG